MINLMVVRILNIEIKLTCFLLCDKNFLTPCKYIKAYSERQIKIVFMHEFLKKKSTFVNVYKKNNKYGSDSIEEYTERR